MECGSDEEAGLDFLWIGIGDVDGLGLICGMLGVQGFSLDL
jgi:hypothetical protein